MSGTYIWRGEDGAPYEYRIYGPDAKWNNVPGNYIFAKWEGSVLGGRWTPLYIGETENFERRLVPSHERWADALQHGMTHVHAHTSSPVQETRRYEEWNLIRQCMPILNRRH